MIRRNRKLPQGLAIAAQSAEFWRRLAPDLTISDGQPGKSVIRQADQIAKDRMTLINDGYLHLDGQDFNVDPAGIAEAMQRIVVAGLPSSFIGVYDQTWAIIARLEATLDGLFAGKAAMVPNFHADHIGRDSQGRAATRQRPTLGLHRDKSPKNVTVWVPLTDATPENGCVYTVPAGQDKNYGAAETTRADASLPSIRALPAKAGDILIWTGEAYTWQGRPNPRAKAPALMSLSWEFQSADTPPLEGLTLDSYPYVPFETRLGLLARQMPGHTSGFSSNPLWRAVQQTLSNRYPMNSPT